MDETGPYLVMELIDGPSLATANVADDRVARIGIEVASALAALHAAGVVHSDVKPGNILLTSDGAKLTDFGIARATADDTATLTQPGVTFGTPAYAAPETVAHGDRSHAADVYSLAVTLHELLTGSRRLQRPPGQRPPTPAHTHHDTPADEWLTAIGADLVYGGDRAYYAPTADRIYLPHPDQFHDAEAFLATSLHEHIHWTGHRNRLGRLDLTATFASLEYATEELVAELGAAIAAARSSFID